MSPGQRRLELLRLAKPDGISNPDMAMWLNRAKELEDWILEAAGQVETPPPETASEIQAPKTGQGRKPPGR